MTAHAFPPVRLAGPPQRAYAARMLASVPDGWVVRFGPPTRTLDQNARLHAMLGAILKSGFEWGGSAPDMDDLKTLFVSAWRKATGRPCEIMQGFEGEPVQMRQSTTTMTKAELTDLMEYVSAWCAERSIDLREPAAPVEGRT